MSDSHSPEMREAASAGQSKATAFLGDFFKQLDGAPAPQEAPSAPGSVAPQTQNPPSVAPAGTTIEGTKPGLADQIRAARTDRAQAQQVATEATKYKTELEAAQKELQQLKALTGATDPFEFLASRKLSKEQQALWGQAFLYDLRPEAAPENFRLDLYKAQQAEKERQQAEQAQKAERDRLAHEEQAQVNRYANDLATHVQSSLGSSPESESWFSNDQGSVDIRAYAQSLLATANNLATAAHKAGITADLTPANVARVLEAEVAKRMARRDSKRAGAAQPKTEVAPKAQVSAVTEATTTSQGLRTGAPVKPDTSDTARRARAAAALFGEGK